MEDETKDTKKPKSCENSEDDDEGDSYENVAESEEIVEEIVTKPEVIPGPSRPKKPEELPLIKALKSDQKHECLIALQELSEMLVVANEEDFIQSRVLSSPNLVQILIEFLEPAPDPYAEIDLTAELMLLACRCLYNLVEANPGASATIAHCKGVDVLVSKLLEIEYIDMAEMVLKVLDRISIDYPSSILKANGLFACLQYLDFFGIHVQRTAVSTVANTCRSLPALYQGSSSSSRNAKDYGNEAFGQVSQVLEHIIRLVTNNDEKINDYAAKSLMRIADWSSRSPEKMNELFEGHIESLLACFDYHAMKSPQTPIFLMVFQTFSKLVKNCEGLRVKLITKYNILGRMRELIVKDGDVVEFAVSRPTDQVLAILDFLSDALPELVCEGVWKISGIAQSNEINASSINNVEYEKRALEEYHNAIFPLLFDIFMSSSLLPVLKKTVLCVAKVIQISSPDLLQTSLKRSPNFGKFIFQLVNYHQFLDSSTSSSHREERVLLHAGLAIAITTLEKCKGSFEKRFYREGVYVELQKLVEKAIAQQPEEDTAADMSEVNDGFSALQELLGDDESGLGARLLGIRRALGGQHGGTTTGFGNNRFSNADLIVSIHLLAAKLSSMINTESLEDGTVGLSGFVDSLIAEGRKGDSKLVLKNLLGISNLLSLSHSEYSDSVTNFEIFNGNLVPTLIDFLTSSSKNDLNHTFPEFEQKTEWNISLRERILLFMDAFFAPSSIGFGSLIAHIHEHISRLEKFPILTASNSDGSFMGRMESLLNIGMFAKQLRLTLSPIDPETAPDSLKSLNLAVPAIASLKSVESYILARSQNRSSSGLPSRSAMQQETLLNVLSDNDTPSDEDEDELDITNSPIVPTPTDVTLEKSASQSSGASKIQKPAASTSNLNSTKRYVLFSYNGTPVPTEATIFGTVFDQTAHEASPVWHRIHSFKYEILDKKPAIANIFFSKKANVPCMCETCKDFYSEFGFSADITDEKGFKDGLVLIGLLNSLNSKFSLNRAVDSQNSNFVSPQTFVNNKLAAKLDRQLSQPLLCISGIHPDWAWSLLFNFRFLIPFDTRLNFLRMTALGPARNMNHWVRKFKPSTGRGGPSLENVVRGERLKVRISRDAVFESMIKVINMEGHHKAALEVEFLNEVGSGLGPTLEFFSLASKGMRLKKGLRLTPSASRYQIWRDDDQNSDEFINPANGIYPRPFNPSSVPSSVTSLFSSIGAFVAKAFLDSRQLDIQFNPLFLDQVFRQPVTTVDVKRDLQKLKNVNISLYNSLVRLESDVNQDIEAMCLDFTLPGYPDIELLPDGASNTVSKENLQEYVKLVVDFTLVSGVKLQVDAFRQGFNQIVPTHFFDCFSLDEIMIIIGGEDDKAWTKEDLRDSIKADHGYDIGSRIITQFSQMLEDFNAEERRLFLSFCTGSPRLPIGGFKALNPPLTVVRKTVDKNLDVNKCLPSVMTCLNYLKIPEYSDQDVMKAAFLYAMKEGQNSFHLS